MCFIYIVSSFPLSFVMSFVFSLCMVRSFFICVSYLCSFFELYVFPSLFCQLAMSFCLALFLYFDVSFFLQFVMCFFLYVCISCWLHVVIYLLCYFFIHVVRFVICFFRYFSHSFVRLALFSHLVYIACSFVMSSFLQLCMSSFIYFAISLCMSSLCVLCYVSMYPYCRFVFLSLYMQVVISFVHQFVISLRISVFRTSAFYFPAMDSIITSVSSFFRTLSLRHVFRSLCHQLSRSFFMYVCITVVSSLCISFVSCASMYLCVSYVCSYYCSRVLKCCMFVFT